MDMIMNFMKYPSRKVHIPLLKIRLFYKLWYYKQTLESDNKTPTQNTFSLTTKLTDANNILHFTMKTNKISKIQK